MLPSRGLSAGPKSTIFNVASQDGGRRPGPEIRPTNSNTWAKQERCYHPKTMNAIGTRPAVNYHMEGQSIAPKRHAYATSWLKSKTNLTHRERSYS